MVMKKFINDPNTLTDDLMSGFAIANANKVVVENKRTVYRKNAKSADKVAIVSMGGAGHEPAISGFVGEGMLDASVVGDIFAAPAFPKVFDALKKTARDAGTLLVVLNHQGDILNGNKAFAMAEKQGIKIQKLVTHDDIAAGPDAPFEDRRGLVGCVPVYKMLGAAAEEGASLDELVAMGEKINGQMATLSVALKPATHPANGIEIGAIADDEMEIGMGQHGESGTGVSKVMNAEQTARKMLDMLLPSAKVQKGDKVLVMINGSGATTLMEMFIVMDSVKKYLDELGIELVAPRCAEDLTVQEMGGFQMCVIKMDDTLLRYWNAPCNTPSLTVC